MNITRISRLFLALVALAVIWACATPAQAQIAEGCSCPAGFPNPRGTTCFDRIFSTSTPAICPLRNVNIGQIAASQQQQSFWGINQILQQKRDHLQYTPVPTGSGPSGYASSPLTDEPQVLSYSSGTKSSGTKKTDPFSGLINQAQPAQTTPLYGTWVQGLGDWERDKALNANDLGHYNNTYTVQG